MFTTENLMVTVADTVRGTLPPRYTFIDRARAAEVGTATEPRPRRLQAVAPITEPLAFRYRLVVSDPGGAPLLRVDKRYRFMRVEARVVLPSGALVGTVRSATPYLVRKRFGFFGARGEKAAVARLESPGVFAISAPNGAEITEMSARPPYRMMIPPQVADPLRSLLVTFPVIVDLSRGIRQ